MEVISSVQIGYGVHALFSTALVSTVLLAELPKRFGCGGPADISPRALATGSVCVMVRNLPEVACLTIVTLAGFLLRLKGDPMRFTDPNEVVVWEQIKREWPILMGADTLLGFQTMVRLCLLLTVSFRIWGRQRGDDKPDEATIGPLSGMAAVFSLGAMVARSSMCARSDAYWLEGPLGFEMPVACETAMVPLLAWFSFNAIRSAPKTALASLGYATWWASHHYFNFAANPSIDRLFTLAHTLEILASLAFLWWTIRAFLHGGFARLRHSIGVMYVVMPFQQALAAYYFLTVFSPANPNQVGAGRPFCLLILGNLLSLCSYLGAAGLYLGARLLDVEASTNHMDTGLAAGMQQDAEAATAVLGITPSALPFGQALMPVEESGMQERGEAFTPTSSARLVASAMLI